MLVRTVTVALIPGRSGTSGAWSSRMSTGTRCTTFTKFPLALSGGRRAKRAPDAPARLDSGLLLERLKTAAPPAGVAIVAALAARNPIPDEARMLAETGDRRFRLGCLATDSFDDVMSSDKLVDVLAETMSEGVPMCVDCGFQPYCGSDPVYHHATQGDVVGFKPSSDFCRKNMAVMRHLVRLIEDDERAASVLKSWL